MGAVVLKREASPPKWRKPNRPILSTMWPEGLLLGDSNCQPIRLAKGKLEGSISYL